MILERLTPNLMVDDLSASLAFYRDLLGFEVALSVPDEPPYGWVMLRHGEAALMLQSRASLAEDLPALAEGPTGASGVFFIRMQGLDELYETLLERAPIVVEPRTTFYGMREFAAADPDGYVLLFAEPQAADA